MSKKRKLKPKVERCVRSVKRKGHSKLSAIKICQKSVNRRKQNR